MGIHTCVCMFVCTCMYRLVYKNMCICNAYVSVCVCVYICMCACVYIYYICGVHVYMCVCVGSSHNVHLHITGLPKSGCSYSVLKVERTLNVHSKAQQFTMADELG